MSREPRSDRHAALEWPACNDGPCDQGRRICPVPHACRVADAEDLTSSPRLVRWLLVALIAVLLATLGVLMVKG